MFVSYQVTKLGAFHIQSRTETCGSANVKKAREGVKTDEPINQTTQQLHFIFAKITITIKTTKRKSDKKP